MDDTAIDMMTVSDDQLKDVMKDTSDTALEIAAGMKNSKEIVSEEEDKRKFNSLIESIRAADNPWGITPHAVRAKSAAMAMLATKNGLHARVPIICKANACPYADQCQLLAADMAPYGEYCAMELAQIDLRAMGYSQDIDYDTASFTDKNLLSELITLDVLLERCKSLMSKDGSPVIEVAIGVDHEGNEVKQPAVSKAWEAYEKISKKRDQVYQLLMMTRKDHKGVDNESDSRSLSDTLHDIINASNIDV